MYKEKIVDVQTGEITFRDFSAAEVAEVEKEQALAAEESAALEANFAARRAVLEKLGLNEEDIKILLG